MILDDNSIVVADTGNYLIRIIFDINNGNTSTLAGTIVDGPTDEHGNPQGGCPPPCMVSSNVYILNSSVSFSILLIARTTRVS